MAIHILLAGVLMGVLSHSLTSASIASVTYNSEYDKLELHDYKANNGIADAVFTNDIATNGWSYLEVYTNKIYSDELQAYTAGYLEGSLTADLITLHKANTIGDYCQNRTSYCDRLRGFLESNMDFLMSQIMKRGETDPYWYQIFLVLHQLSGLEDGYKGKLQKPHISVDVFGLMLLNLFGDLEDLEGYLNHPSPRHVLGSGSCSALVKVLPGNRDVYFSHVTWNNYNSMLRILKKYRFQFRRERNNENIIPGHTVTFSSYPGCIFSGDDYYLLSSGLAVAETTNSNNNKTLAKKKITFRAVFDWTRNIVSNRLATNGQEWTKLFKKYNSGTYNNQFMVLDYNKFEPGQPLKNGLLWIAEQMPGYMVTGDVTDVLRAQQYWPSYNVPYFPLIFNVSGLPDLVAKYGDWFTYDKTPRALIFKRDHGKVVNMESMAKLMRYNDFHNDPLSRCNCTPPFSAENAISARCDLNDPKGRYPIPALSYRSHGATDMKLTNSTLFRTFQFVSVSGPTDESLPPFKWSTSGFADTVPHAGHPDLFQFPKIIHQWGSG